MITGLFHSEEAFDLFQTFTRARAYKEFGGVNTPFEF